MGLDGIEKTQLKIEASKFRDGCGLVSSSHEP